MTPQLTTHRELPGPSRSRRSFVQLSIRYIGLAFLMAIAWAAAWRGADIRPSLLVGVSVIVLFFDTRNLVSLKNFFLAYTGSLFVLGTAFFDTPTRLYDDMAVFVLIFVAGYALSEFRRQPDRENDAAQSSNGKLPLLPRHRVRLIQEFMALVACAYLLMLALNITRYGAQAFYSGQSLVDQATSYGKPSVGGGLNQIVSFALRFSAVAGVVVYAYSCWLSNSRIRYVYPLILLVAIPIVSLARSDALHGAGILLVIYALDRRVRPYFARAQGRAEVEPALAVVPLKLRHTFQFGAVVFVALLAALVIGGIRQNRLAPDQVQSTQRRSLFQSEFTPLIAYSEIKDNDAVLDRQYGSTIVWPLVFKLVPRGLAPGKPMNSGAYYMSVLRPAEFANGYALPPTLFGDIHLNFGPWGSVFACFVVGFASAKLDRAYRGPRPSRLPWFIIGYASYYSLLRSPLSETLSSVLLTVAVFLVLRRLVLGGGPPSEIREPAPDR